MVEVLNRHTMVKVSPAAWAATMAGHPELASEPIVKDWVHAGFPLVVRRPNCGEPGGTIPLGLPLPAAYGKRRIAVALAPSGIVEQSAPLLLAQAARTAPPAWRKTIDRLLDLIPETRTFGSLAWQHLTGLRYLSDSSDLDLLWSLSSVTQVHTWPSDIARIARAAPMRLDGEIIGAAGGVQWRELTSPDAGEILVKGHAGVHSMTRTAFLAGTVP